MYNVVFLESRILRKSPACRSKSVAAGVLASEPLMENRPALLMNGSELPSSVGPGQMRRVPQS
jgi:hypothetical protein